MRTLDTRDLYTRKCKLEELRQAVEDAQEALDELTAEGDPQEVEDYWGRHEQLTLFLDSAIFDYGDEEKEELAELEDLESEISDFRHGEDMIPESDFEDYARQFAEDCCGMEDDVRWPFNCIDWEQAAEELKQDYTSVEYQGTTYLVRA